MTLDDGSGATIEVTCKRQIPKTTTRTDSCFATSRDATAPPLDCNLGKDGEIGIAPSENKISLNGIDIGSVVKVKGFVGEFRGEEQVLLERIRML